MESQQGEAPAPILAAYAPEDDARGPVEFGLAASRLTGAPLVVAIVHRAGGMVTQFVGDVEDAPGEARTIEHLRMDLHRTGHDDVEVAVLESRTVTGGLEQAMEQRKPLLIVLGSSQRSAVGSVLTGGTAESVIQEARCPVAVVPKGYRRPETGVRIVGGAFGSKDEGGEALKAAARLARASDVKLRAIVVVDGKRGHETPTSELQQEAEASVREALGDEAERANPEVDVRVGDAGDALVAASRDVDLLVIGTRARGARRAALFGSVSRTVANRAACPVLVIPPGAKQSTGALLGTVEAR
jgi:nucleotide-binding universal stress UspA family protein